MIRIRPFPLLVLIALIAPSLSALNAAAQPAPATQPQIVRLDAVLSQIFPANAKIEQVASGFKWTEGPIWIPAGYLLFSDIPNNRICKVTPDGKVSTWLQPSGYKGSAPYGGPEPGSNGLTLDRRGRLTIAGHAQRDIWRLESLNPKGQVTILADTYQGKRLNSPNDLVYGPDGSLYFTDPPYGLRTQQDNDPAKQLHINGVYRIPGALYHKPGAPPDRAQLQLLVKDLTRPNGLAFSPDGKYLYVDNSQPKKLWMRYRVKADGTLTDGKVFFDATSDTGPGNPDGMKVDQRGNIYSAGPGGVWIFSPAGKHLGTITVPGGRVGNVAWGGADGRTLYIMGGTVIYRVTLKIPGIRPR